MISCKLIAIHVSLVSRKLGYVLPFELCVLISLKAGPTRLGIGRSSYARKRRAKIIGRCHLCYRVNPKFYFTKRCNGVDCKPGLNYPSWVEDFIRYGVYTKGSNCGDTPQILNS
uniref:RNA silencing suppressor n=1 Tax=Cowpea mild mottle virus TaxID=67761 RepID=D2K9J3_9VIRU|nr:11 kDa putative nucleic acid binding protein [Cowpea mild mottle virus]AGZ15236.1 putative nucleic acid binding protein [Cowpea mild mottle virus]QTG11376.1 nucleic acid binding protein [Cowpea mild mottle virus]QTG11377.1 nucleic acid binding protein [Cowpea mild mottle virus]QTG11378.1 nucleic acid binding protein [Cowpea mild mottle virus]